MVKRQEQRRYWSADLQLDPGRWDLQTIRGRDHPAYISTLPEKGSILCTVVGSSYAHQKL